MQVTARALLLASVTVGCGAGEPGRVVRWAASPDGRLAAVEIEHDGGGATIAVSTSVCVVNGRPMMRVGDAASCSTGQRAIYLLRPGHGLLMSWPGTKQLRLSVRRDAETTFFAERVYDVLVSVERY
jgi:hypothetical protein